jgi:hypothetical protein
MSDSEMGITETCSCGATLRISPTFPSFASSAATAWRKDHLHEFPPLAKPERVRIPLARSRA